MGATSLPVTAGTGTSFTVGQLVTVDGGDVAEQVRVTATAANTLTVTPCAKAHASGASVVGAIAPPSKDQRGTQVGVSNASPA